VAVDNCMDEKFVGYNYLAQCWSDLKCPLRFLVTYIC